MLEPTLRYKALPQSLMDPVMDGAISLEEAYLLLEVTDRAGDLPFEVTPDLMPVVSKLFRWQVFKDLQPDSGETLH